MVDAGPAGPVHPDRRVDVLGHAVRADAADRLERAHPDEGAGPAPEWRRPAGLGRRDHPVEDSFLVECLAVALALVLERVEVVEVLGRLDEGQLLVDEIGQGGGQEAGRRDVVGVEDGHDVGLDPLQRVVQVAGLRVPVVRAGHVPGAQPLGQAADLVPPAVVEDPRLVGRFEGDGRRDRRQQDLVRLVVGRDQDRDLPAAEVAFDRRRLGIEIPQGDGVQHEAQGVVHLDHEQRQGDPPPGEIDRAGEPPGQVRGRHRDRGEGPATDQELASVGLRRRHRTVRELSFCGVLVSGRYSDRHRLRAYGARPAVRH